MLQDFGIPAISSANFVATLTLAVIMVQAHATRRVYPGFNHWMAAQVVLAAGMILLTLKAYLPPWIALLLGNSLLMLSLVLIYTGFVRFFDLSNHHRWPSYVLLFSAVLGFAWMLYTDSPAPLRSLLFSLFSAVLMLRIAMVLLMQKQLRGDPLVRMILTAILMAMGFFSARALILWRVSTEIAFWDQQLLAAAFYVGIVFSILLVFGFLQLVQARTEGELQAAQAKAEDLANTDRLTGAWNRRRFEHEAERETARATRYRQPLSLIAFDIDHFKLINDQHGHQAGDEVLTGICKLVGNRIRATDALIRWGGDEFLIMTPMTNAAEAHALAQLLRADIAAQDFKLAGKVTLSMGVTEYFPPESLEAWLARADRGIYAAKAQGRDQVMINLVAPASSSA